jgi:hypothetical protein
VRKPAAAAARGWALSDLATFQILYCTGCLYIQGTWRILPLGAEPGHQPEPKSRTLEERTQAAAAALAGSKAKDDQDGGQQLLDEGLAALFGKKRPAREGDIALYLKRMFNEKKDPGDDDIACLAGMLSMQLEDSSDEEHEAQPEPEEDSSDEEDEAQPEEGKAAGGKLLTVEAVDKDQSLLELAASTGKALLNSGE